MADIIQKGTFGKLNFEEGDLLQVVSRKSAVVIGVFVGFERAFFTGEEKIRLECCVGGRELFVNPIVMSVNISKIVTMKKFVSPEVQGIK